MYITESFILGRKQLITILFLLTAATSLWSHDLPQSGEAAVNGIQIYYEIEGSGTPILLMHGGLGDDHWAFHWPGSIPPLADSYKLVYYDHRANGRSGGDASTISLETLSSDAEALRKSLGLGKVVVLGFSFGGFVAIDYALRYPESVLALILYSTSPMLDEPTGLMPPGAENRTGEFANHFLSEDKMKLYEEMQQAALQKLYGKKLAKYQIKKNAAAYAGYAILSSLDHRPRLREIHVPTLILSGKWDWLFGASVEEEMAKAIPGARLAVFQNSGHFINVEEPEAFQKKIREYLSSVSSGF